MSKLVTNMVGRVVTHSEVAARSCEAGVQHGNASVNKWISHKGNWGEVVTAYVADGVPLYEIALLDNPDRPGDKGEIVTLDRQWISVT